MPALFATLLLLFGLTCTPPLLAQNSAPPLVWMSEQYPPYNFTDEDGHPQGIAVEVLALIWQQLARDRHPEEIQFLPWARAYMRLKREPGTALFSMTYSPVREQLFRFVGPLIPIRMVLLARKDRALKISDDSQLRGLRIGVVREDIGEQLLRERQLDGGQLLITNLATSLVQLLANGRVDAIAYSYDVAAWNLLKLGLDPADYEIVYTLLESQLGYAFHPQTDPALLAELQTALDQLQSSGAVAAVHARYLQRPPAAHANSAP